MRNPFPVWKDTSGNFGLIFALLSVPVMLAGGLAVDYVGLSVEKSELQNAADAAALAVAREGKISELQAREIARQIVAANFGFSAAKVSATLTDGVATVHAVVDRPMVFGGFMGKKSMPVAVNSEATYAYTKYEIALVLDTTGSMAGGKLTSMKDAVIGLVDGMADLKLGKEQIKFSLIPYAGFVNVGPEFGPVVSGNGVFVKPGAGWLDQDAKAPIPQSDLPSEFSRFAMYKHLNVKWPGCVETRIPKDGALHDVDDTVPNANEPNSLFTPFFAVDEPDTAWKYPNSYLPDGGTPIKGKNATETDKETQLSRYGKAGTYVKPKNAVEAILQTLKWKKPKIDDSPSSFYSNKRDPKGPGFGCEVEPIVPLTSKVDDITKTVKKLEANGSTNMLEGVMWGWRVLSDREPFTDGAPKSDKSVEKIMIFLTDGQNSFGNLNNDLGSSYTSMGYLVDGRLDGMTAASSGQTNSALDKKTLTACTNAKKDGVTIYTIRLEEPDAATGTLLQKCATSKSHYFDAPSRNQLAPIFDAIKKGVVKLRLTS
ncbi:TadE/TadG family protein [Hoeflea sp. YIM 152468]|uniref:TadE/TadG family type IV pilus assembly protein n=1 Tax=Hoeflea sp. YIM 152468 TaxID=3031759 RepID=UPI0023DB967B|nr:TadE/TadG family type IV pilus assembly protein [Hoeflea sp. YIM 152468]MDF1607134.1 TadE/TadG family protein [Hoeflea sp. YIM 152468]